MPEVSYEQVGGGHSVPFHLRHLLRACGCSDVVLPSPQEPFDVLLPSFTLLARAPGAGVRSLVRGLCSLRLCSLPLAIAEVMRWSLLTW